MNGRHGGQVSERAGDSMAEWAGQLAGERPADQSAQLAGGEAES